MRLPKPSGPTSGAAPACTLVTLTLLTAYALSPRRYTTWATLWGPTCSWGCPSPSWSSTAAWWWSCWWRWQGGCVWVNTRGLTHMAILVTQPLLFMLVTLPNQLGPRQRKELDVRRQGPSHVGLTTTNHILVLHPAVPTFRPGSSTVRPSSSCCTSRPPPATSRCPSYCAWACRTPRGAPVHGC